MGLELPPGAQRAMVMSNLRHQHINADFMHGSAFLAGQPGDLNLITAGGISPTRALAAAIYVRMINYGDDERRLKPLAEDSIEAARIFQQAWEQEHDPKNQTSE